jgi:hypothetical protein
MHDSILCIGNLENTDSLNYILQVFIYFVRISKNYVSITTDLIRKVSTYWEAIKLKVADLNSQNLLFSCLKT